MTTVNDIITYMEKIAPQEKKESWDNVGLLCGRQSKEVRTILVALDPFEDVANEAVRLHADLIVTHHPLIFRPLYRVTDDTAVGRVIMTLVQHDISAFNAHTNLDVAPDGVGHCLADAIGLKDVSVIAPFEYDGQNRPWGLLRKGTAEKQPLEEFLKNIKRSLGIPCVRYAAARDSVQHVAVGGGACAGEWRSVLEAGCDTFVTSDAKYNDFWDAHDAGLTLIDAGHFYTENPVCLQLKNILQAAFPDMNVFLSSAHSDCMQFF